MGPDRRRKAIQLVATRLVPVWVLLLGATNLACERPFVDIANPKSEVRSPDLSLVQTDSTITLAVQVTSFRQVSRVFVNDVAMSYDTPTDQWTAPISLSEGVNVLRIASFDEEERPGVDTAYAYQLAYSITDDDASMPVGTGGHAATTLSDGGIFITGGAESTTSPALSTAFLYSPASATIEPLNHGLTNARIGHTATNIGEDNILIVGGGTRAQIDDVSELIETVEMYSQATGSFKVIPFSGKPIRRMYHTATYRSVSEGIILDIIGGIGDTQYTPEPILSTRFDIRSFYLYQDTLFALSPAVGPYIERMTGHSQTALSSTSPGEPAVYLINGIGGLPPGGPVGLVVDFTSNFGILVNPAAGSFSPRSYHAAVRLDDNTVGFFGGIDWPSGDVLATGELYIQDIERSFAMPLSADTHFSPRYLHTVTTLSPGTTVLIGGFDTAGNGLTQNQRFSYLRDRRP